MQQGRVYLPVEEEEEDGGEDADDVDERDEGHEQVEAALLAAQPVRLQLVLGVAAVVVLAKDAHQRRAGNEIINKKRNGALMMRRLQAEYGAASARSNNADGLPSQRFFPSPEV